MFMCGCVGVGVGVCVLKTKTPDRNDLKIGTVVILDTVLNPVLLRMTWKV